MKYSLAKELGRIFLFNFVGSSGRALGIGTAAIISLTVGTKILASAVTDEPQVLEGTVEESK